MSLSSPTRPDRLTSSRRETSSTRQMNSLRESASMVFGTILGRRKDDYHGDIFHDAPSLRERQQPSTPVRTALPPLPSLPRGPRGFWRDPERRRARFRTLLGSRLWKTALVVGACLLLFGEQVRIMFIPPAADNAVDSVFCACILFFLIDIALRCDAEDGYCTLACREGAGCGRWMMGGSFLFWCDLVSTLALFYDISWLRTRFFTESSIRIVLNEFGEPVRAGSGGGVGPRSARDSLNSSSTLSFDYIIRISKSQLNGLDSLNRPRPFELDPALLIAIFQSARVARFIRSSTAVKISSKVNWCLVSHIMNPIWLIKAFAVSFLYGVCGGPDRDTNTNRSTTTNEEPKPPPVSSSPTATRLSEGTNGSHGRPHFLSRCRSSSLGVAEEEDRFFSSVNKASPKSGIAGFYDRLRRWWGAPPPEQDEVHRHFAAVRIQRAWRAVLHQRHTDEVLSSEFLATDVAWKGRLSHSTIHVSQSSRATSIRRSPGDPLLGRAPVRSTPANPSSAVVGSSYSEGNHDSKRRNESQVGSAMRELTGQRVAIGIIVALLFTVLFTYTEEDATRPTTMVVLHSQTSMVAFADKSLDAARSSSVPDLFYYQMANGENRSYDVIENNRPPSELRPSEKLNVTVITNVTNITTIGLFSYRDERREEGFVAFLSTLFILLLWFFGVSAFAGPVMILVVIPIERMVRLLGMLMVDPLGYQSTSRFKRFADEENEITKNTRWTKEILKGMETSFLMSTILRIGSLMKVGFGSAGVEIIRNNLEKGQSKNMLGLSSQGSTVSCIFLFCDIRNFTDATECLQEEVFVFTNRIAAVVHSYVHSYGGSANKNVGDAFLLSWLLDEDSSTLAGSSDHKFSSQKGDGFTAKSSQADKCLLSVVRICMALHHDEYYIGAMTEAARQALVMKLQHRKGPIVQMGFGMHAGRAVQGAIGSQRKIDATYVSEAVERAEFLESSTKKYGLRMLMSDSFHRLLHPSNRRRCRKIDQILIKEDDDEDADDEGDDEPNGDMMELFTFDVDIDALWAKKIAKPEGRESDSASDSGSRRGALGKNQRENRRSLGAGAFHALQQGGNAGGDSDEQNNSAFLGAATAQPSSQSEFGPDGDDGNKVPTLVLPTGPALYNANVWTSEDMRTMRQLYSDGLFFQNFMSGLQSFYAKDWDHASQCFTTILQRFEDGPSRYFLRQIEEHNGKPPRDFVGYGIH
jgi:class 3 adenylate cyclase